MIDDKDLEATIARRQQAMQRVCAMLVRQLRLAAHDDEIDPDTVLFGSGLGLDSIDAVELVVSLQSEFKVRLPEETVSALPLRTVNTLVDLILEQEARDGR